MLKSKHCKYVTYGTRAHHHATRRRAMPYHAPPMHAPHHRPHRPAAPHPAPPHPVPPRPAQHPQLHAWTICVHKTSLQRTPPTGRGRGDCRSFCIQPSAPAGYRRERVATHGVRRAGCQASHTSRRARVSLELTWNWPLRSIGIGLDSLLTYYLLLTTYCLLTT